MLARANFQPYQASQLVLGNSRALRALRRVPYPYLHKALVTGAWLETWLRWPLKTLKLTDSLSETFATVDPGGRRLGLTPEVQRRFRDHQLLLDIPDLAVLLLNLDDRRFRRKALRVEGIDHLTQEMQRGPGAIVIGFRIGPYPVIPLVLSGLGHDVSMIVSSEPVVDAGQAMSEQYAPGLSRGIRYISSLDRGVLTQARRDLDEGRLVSTLLELSPFTYAKTTPVRFLGWETQTAYGIPYLAAMTQRSIVPLVITRERGPRYRMRFLEAIPPPSPQRSAVLETTQTLWSVLEQQVLKHPEQWIGWTRLQSQLGIDLTQPSVTPAHAPS